MSSHILLALSRDRAAHFLIKLILLKKSINSIGRARSIIIKLIANLHNCIINSMLQLTSNSDVAHALSSEQMKPDRMSGGHLPIDDLAAPRIHRAEVRVNICPEACFTAGDAVRLELHTAAPVYEQRAREHHAAPLACRPFDMISVASGAESRAMTDTGLSVDASTFICQQVGDSATNAAG